MILINPSHFSFQYHNKAKYPFTEKYMEESRKSSVIAKLAEAMEN